MKTELFNVLQKICKRDENTLLTLLMSRNLSEDVREQISFLLDVTLRKDIEITYGTHARSYIFIKGPNLDFAVQEIDYIDYTCILAGLNTENPVQAEIEVCGDLLSVLYAGDVVLIVPHKKEDL